MADPALVLELSARIKPLLAGHPPDVQGAALADLLSIWLAGHPPQVRRAVLAAHVRGVLEMLPVTERELFPDGHPTQH